jgi:hypothetical protein
MPFDPAFDSIKNRVYIVGCFNDTKQKRGKFYLLGNHANGADGGQRPSVSFDNFIELLQPQVSERESGVIDEKNWFFRIGERPEVGADLLAGPGFPGESIFTTVKEELSKYAELLRNLVNVDFEAFAVYKSNLQAPGARHGVWLPPGLLGMFIEGLADNWLLSGSNPDPARTMIGFTEWNAANNAGGGADGLLRELRDWSRTRFSENNHFKNRVQSLQRLSQICKSRTLLKLLVYWPYRHILDKARTVWRIAKDKNPGDNAITNAGQSQRHDEWDVLLATGWINKQSLQEVEGDSLASARQQLQQLRTQYQDGHEPILAPSIKRDPIDIRKKQIEDQVKGWVELYKCDDLAAINANEVTRIKGLLRCPDDAGWNDAIQTAKEYQQLWDLGPSSEQKARGKRLRDNSAETFARLAVRESFNPLFQAPNFDPSHLPPIYESEFMAIYAWCLLQGAPQAMDELRAIGRAKSIEYQTAGGDDFRSEAAKTARGKLQFKVGSEANKKIIELTKRQGNHFKIAEVEPAVRAFVYGVSEQVHKMPGSQSLLYLLRYSPNLAGAGQATMARDEHWRVVMRAGIEGEILSTADQAASKFNDNAERQNVPERKVEVKRKNFRTQAAGGPPPNAATPANQQEDKKDDQSREPLRPDNPFQVDFKKGTKDDSNAVTAPDTSKLEQEIAEFLIKADEEGKLLQAAKEDAVKRQETAKKDLNSVDARSKEQAQKHLEQAELDLKKNSKGEKPVEVDFEVADTVLNELAKENAKRFQEAWRTIFDHVSGAGRNDDDLKNALNRLLLVELLLVTQNHLEADKFQWLDLQLLLDMVGAGDLKTFLAKHSLTEYSDVLDGAKGVSERLRELEKHAEDSLLAMRQIVSDLHGMKHFLTSANNSSDAQVIIFNGTADEYFAALKEHNLNAENANGNLWLELFTGNNGESSPSFLAPACVYFTSMAFPGGESEKQHLASNLETLGLRQGNRAMALPPSLVDAEPLVGPDPARWPGSFSNPLDTVPLHFIGPSPWLRSPAVSHNFSTVIPSGYLMLIRLVNSSGTLPQVDSRPLTDNATSFYINLRKTQGQLFPTDGTNLASAFALKSGQASFALTYNLYLCLLDALIKNAQGLRGQPNAQTLVQLFRGPHARPNANGFPQSLWDWIAFVDRPEDASRIRSANAFVAPVVGDWTRLWWHPIVVSDSNTLDSLKTFLMTSKTKGKVDPTGPSFTSDIVGWLDKIVARY